MEYRLEDLIDIPLFQRMQDELNEIYSFPSAIIDNEGKVLTATAWQDVCTKFYRADSVSVLECIKSDQYILSHLAEAHPAVSYRCPHGLMDNATPIIIDGKHLGNFFTGQLFLEPPDEAYYRNEASVRGFDEASFLDAVRRVPVWPKEKLDRYLTFIRTFTEILAGIGLENLREIEARRTITEQHAELGLAFEKIDTSLKEKEILLRELYHRTKNNMNVIASWLELEAMGEGNPDIDRLVRRMVLRIQAMALVHQELYTARNLSKIEFGKYLRELVQSIASYQGEKGLKIDLRFDLQHTEVSIDAAVPAGLAVNELVVNAFAHAFTDGQVGTIAISLSNDDSGELRIVVADDGRGLDEGIEKGLGLVTVSDIVEHQLQGRLSRSGPPGLAWEIRFRDAALTRLGGA